MELELWAVIDEAPAYDVSTWGRVRRRTSTSMSSDVSTCVDVASWPNAKGYHLVSIELPTGRPALRYVHRLVLTAFRRDPRIHEQGNHEDLNKGHNGLDNLSWTSPAENTAHYRRAAAEAAGQLPLFR